MAPLLLLATDPFQLAQKYKEHNFPAVLAERGWNIPAAGIEHTPSALFAEYYTWAQTETLKRCDTRSPAASFAPNAPLL